MQNQTHSETLYTDAHKRVTLICDGYRRANGFCPQGLGFAATAVSDFGLSLFDHAIRPFVARVGKRLGLRSVRRFFREASAHAIRLFRGSPVCPAPGPYSEIPPSPRRSPISWSITNPCS